MPDPNYQYLPTTIAAIHAELLALIDAGTGAATVDFLQADSTPLAQVVLTDPAGTIDPTTGRLTLTSAGPVTVAQSGTVALLLLSAPSGTPIMAFVPQVGAAPVEGAAVLQTLDLVAGAELSIESFTFG